MRLFQFNYTPLLVQVASNANSESNLRPLPPPPPPQKKNNEPSKLGTGNFPLKYPPPKQKCLWTYISISPSEKDVAFFSFMFLFEEIVLYLLRDLFGCSFSHCRICFAPHTTVFRKFPNLLSLATSLSNVRSDTFWDAKGYIPDPNTKIKTFPKQVHETIKLFDII